MEEQYYEEELRAIGEGMQAFSAGHPDRARRLSLDAGSDRDPSVERLFEGFAHIAARTRVRIDEARASFARSLIDEIMPDARSDIPSVCIASLDSRLPEAFHLPRGAEVLSRSAGLDGTVCRFTSVMPVTGLPLEITAVEIVRNPAGTGSLSLLLVPRPGAVIAAGSLTSLRLFIDADRAASHRVHRWICRETVAVEIGVEGGETIRLRGDEAIRAEGYDPAESLLVSRIPDPRGIVRDYLAAPEKFLFFSIDGFDGLRWDGVAPESIKVVLHFAEALPNDISLLPRQLRLNCTILINLFEHDLEPCRFDGTRSRIGIRTGNGGPADPVIHQLLRVESIDRRDGLRTTIPRRELGSSASASWTLERSSESTHPILELHRNPYRDDGSLREETLSVNARCHNGRIPREHLGVGDISRPGRRFPTDLKITSLTRPSPGLWRRPRDGDVWLSLALGVQGLSSLSDLRVLRELFPAADGIEGSLGERLAKSLRGVSSAAAMIPCAGGLVSGSLVVVEMDAACFAESHDEHIFGRVLHCLFCGTAPVNHPLSLCLRLLPDGECLEYPAENAIPGRGRPWI